MFILKNFSYFKKKKDKQTKSLLLNGLINDSFSIKPLYSTVILAKIHMVQLNLRPVSLCYGYLDLNQQFLFPKKEYTVSTLHTM